MASKRRNIRAICHSFVIIISTCLGRRNARGWQLKYCREMLRIRLEPLRPDLEPRGDLPEVEDIRELNGLEELVADDEVEDDEEVLRDTLQGGDNRRRSPWTVTRPSVSPGRVDLSPPGSPKGTAGRPIHFGFGRRLAAVIKSIYTLQLLYALEAVCRRR
ncbi:hypothetical protein AAG570_006492 [Ranatra chinensis]|uniref:Uncharacterized protein n=1 Tax=Ranatra chinensis TaxID=642074 RepID=A0ABD0YU63_9HEMI